MATRTVEALAMRVLRNMNHLRPGQDPDQETMATITADYYPTIHAKLVDRKAAYWMADAIPAAVFDDLAWYVAVQIAPTFGALPIVLQAIGEQTADGASMKLMRQLRIHMEADDNHERTPMLEY